MEYDKIALLVGLVCLLIWSLIRLIRAKTIKSIVVASVFSGVLALAAVCVTGQLESETLHINPYTLGVSSILGIPGVIAMMAIQLIWAL